MPPTGGGGVNITANPATAADKMANLASISCVGPLDSFQPPAGSFLGFFCTNATTPNTSSTHVPSRVTGITAGDCTAMFNWVATGGSGQIPTCP